MTRRINIQYTSGFVLADYRPSLRLVESKKVSLLARVSGRIKRMIYARVSAQKGTYDRH